VRKNAVESLGSFPRESAQSIPGLLERLGDDDVEVRRATILALGNLGKGQSNVEEALKKYTQDSDAVTRLDALVAMAELGKTEETGVPTLLKALGSSKEATARAAAKALSMIAGEKPQEVLPGILEILDKQEQPAAINSLRILRGMKSQSSEAAPRIASLYKGVTPHDRREIVDTLTAIDTEGNYTIPVLIEALKEPAPYDRRDALLGLMKYRSKVDLFIDSLTDELKDNDLENKFLAINIVRGLGQQGSKALPAMIMLTNDQNPQVRAAVVNAIGVFGPSYPEVVRTLAQTVADTDLRVRMASVVALENAGKTSPQEVLPILQRALDSEKLDGAKRRIKVALDGLNEKPASPTGQQSAEKQQSNK